MKSRSSRVGVYIICNNCQGKFAFCFLYYIFRSLLRLYSGYTQNNSHRNIRREGGEKEAKEERKRNRVEKREATGKGKGKGKGKKKGKGKSKTANGMKEKHKNKSKKIICHSQKYG